MIKKFTFLGRFIICSIIIIFSSSGDYIIAQNNQNSYEPTIPESWGELDELFSSDTSNIVSWWKNFDDDQLSDLIEKARSNNYNVQIALARIEQSRSAYLIEKSTYFPSLDAQVDWMPQKTSKGVAGIGAGTNHPGSAMLNMSWEVDVFGKIRKSVKSAESSYFASIDDYNAVMISLFADIAESYINLRVYQKRLFVAKNNVTSQKETLKITEARYESGLASDLDVSQAQTILAYTLATIPGYKAAIDQQINNLGVLIGTYPWELRSELLLAKDIPNLPLNIAVGVPRDLIRQRPDVKEAENNLIAQTLTLGASKSDILPKFYISGSLGYQSDGFQNFVKEDNMAWSLGATTSWTIFDGLRIDKTIKLNRALLDESEFQYKQTILQALQESDNAITLFSRTLEQQESEKQAVIASIRTFDLSLKLYKNGLSDFQNVLDAQRSLFNYQDQLVVTEGNVLLYLIQLYKSLGGGWDYNNNN